MQGVGPPETAKPSPAGTVYVSAGSVPDRNAKVLASLIAVITPSPGYGGAGGAQ